MAWWIFQSVIVIAALTAAVTVVCRLGRVGPAARHALWVIVLLKFVTPAVVVWPWAMPDPFGLATLDARAGSGAPTADPAGARPDESGPGVVSVADAEAPPPADGSPGLGALAPWIGGLWIAGSVALVLIEGVRIARLSRRVKSSGPADPAIVARVAQLCARMDVRPVPVLSVPGIAAPLIWGVGAPRLLWPADLAVDSAVCVDGLLVHELAHVKRRDHLVGWIELAAGVVWWWNPLFWFVKASRREQAELACDAWVISALPDGRRAYAESLLALSGAAMRSVPPMAVVGISATTRRVLERRLIMIMKGRASLHLPWVGLFALALIAAATLPAWATSPQQTPPPTTPPVVTQATPPSPASTPPPAVIAEPPRLRQTPARQNPPAQATPPQEKVPVIRELSYPRGSRARADLPPEGRQLLDGFDADQKAIQAEADRKVEARREALKKELEALQEKYTKAGNLDAAIAIRDFIRAGLPGPYRFIRR